MRLQLSRGSRGSRGCAHAQCHYMCVEHPLHLPCVYFCVFLFPIILSPPPIPPRLSSYNLLLLSPPPPLHPPLRCFAVLLVLRRVLVRLYAQIRLAVHSSSTIYPVYPTRGCPIRASGHFARKASTRHVSSAPSSSILAISVENASFCFFATLFFSFSAARNSSSFLPCRRVRGAMCIGGRGQRAKGNVCTGRRMRVTGTAFTCRGWAGHRVSDHFCRPSPRRIRGGVRRREKERGRNRRWRRRRRKKPRCW